MTRHRPRPFGPSLSRVPTFLLTLLLASAGAASAHACQASATAAAVTQVLSSVRLEGTRLSGTPNQAYTLSNPQGHSATIAADGRGRVRIVAADGRSVTVVLP